MGITKNQVFDQKTNDLSQVFKALGHPARIAIIEYLLRTPHCICGDIVDELPLAQSTISRHLAELKNSGLIQGNISGNNICYCINPQRWNAIASFVALATSSDCQGPDCC